MKGPWAIPNDPRMYEGNFAAVERHREAVDEQLGDERPDQDDDDQPTLRRRCPFKKPPAVRYPSGDPVCCGAELPCPHDD